MATSLPATEIVQGTQHRYHFSLVGQVKEIVFQNKAIVHFNLNGKEEKGILLSKMFYVTGKPLEEVMEGEQQQLEEGILQNCYSVPCRRVY